MGIPCMAGSGMIVCHFCCRVISGSCSIRKEPPGDLCWYLPCSVGLEWASVDMGFGCCGGMLEQLCCGLRAITLCRLCFLTCAVCCMVLSVWYDDNYQRLSHDGLHSFALMRPLKLWLTMLTVSSCNTCM